MTVPADGVPRLMHFVDARLARLKITKEEAAERGFPDPSTLAKVRDRDAQRAPTVRTLLRIDGGLGWQPGSAAVVLLGGHPLTVTARSTEATRARAHSARPVTADEVVSRLLDQLGEQIDAARRDLEAIAKRVEHLGELHEALGDTFRYEPAAEAGG
jgi:hypothetical protein